MDHEHATVKSHVSEDEPPDGGSPAAEAIRLRLADAWGAMGAAWGVAPAIARVHAYLMTRQAALTERERVGVIDDVERQRVGRFVG